MEEATYADYEQERMDGLKRARLFDNERIINLTEKDNTYKTEENKNLKRGLRGAGSENRRKEALKNLINKGKDAEKYLPKGMREELDDVRKKYKDSKKLAGQGKTLVKSMTPWGLASLFGQINFFRDMPYFFALFAAILKDILDPILFAAGSVTIAGVVTAPLTAVAVSLGIVISILTAIFIAMMMILGNMIQPDEHDRTVFQSIILKKFGVLAVVFIIETFFVGINSIPIQTIGVILIYLFALAERKGRKRVLNKSV